MNDLHGSLNSLWLALLGAGTLVLLGGCSTEPLTPPVSDFWHKIGTDGDVVDQAAAPHHCVLDQRTGLMWEVKRAQPGLHFHGHTYSWYSTDSQVNMSDAGLSDGGDCVNSRCDTQGFVETVNETGLCGFNDWSIPARQQLMTLGDRGLMDATGLIVDTEFFPYTMAGEYWSAETFRLYPQSAWVVDMRHGLDRADHKSEAKPVRLVRRHQPPAGETQ